MSIIFDRNNTSYNIQIFNSLKKINEEYNKITIHMQLS